MKRRTWRALAVLATAAVVVGTWLPADALQPAPLVSADKLLHSGAFAALGFLWRRAGLRAGPALGLVLGLAVLTELGQAVWAPGRSAELGDVAADLVGGAVGVFLAHLVGGAPDPRASAAASARHWGVRRGPRS